MTTDIFCFYLQNRLIQTSQAGVLLSPLVFPSLIKDSSDLAVDKQVPILTKLLTVRLRLGLYRAAQKLMGENLKPVWTEFSTIS